MSDSNEIKPTYWVIRNGLVDCNFTRSKETADLMVKECQRQHDLSGSLASYHAVPLFTQAVDSRTAELETQVKSLRGWLLTVQKVAAVASGLSTNDKWFRQVNKILDETKVEK